MTRSPLAVLALGVAAACARARGGATQANASLGVRSFVVFDGLRYAGKPDFRPLGMRPIVGSSFLPSGESGDRPLEVENLTKLGLSRAEVVYLDIESLPVCNVPDERIEDDVRVLTAGLQRMRAMLPGKLLGFYGLLPVRDYWAINTGDQVKLEAWHRCNSRLTTFAEGVDVIFPSLYTFYNDSIGWDKFAVANLREARRYGKPVYAFLWPQFHDSNAALKGTFIPGKLWRHELELCRREADGVVLWAYSPAPWDPDAPWWRETKSFLLSLR